MSNTMKQALIIIGKALLTGLTLVIGFYVFLILLLTFTMDYRDAYASEFFKFVNSVSCGLVLPFFSVLLWLKGKKRKIALLICLIFSLVSISVPVIKVYKIESFKKSEINMSPNIDVYEYLPYDEDSKIVKIESKTLRFTNFDTLPRIDGAAALFPTYSAFVNATYPSNIYLDTNVTMDSKFEYRNTPEGYKALAEKRSDIFIGVYPSKEQIEYAESCGTEFEFTQIGVEAFVFITHKDNPISDLTTQQIQDIYSGEITNWKEVGGENIEIAAYQRNEGSGSQSMLKRFMGDIPLVEPPTERRNEFMGGIIEEVSNYHSQSNSLGFSFRYYVEGIIKNPEIKMLSIDGVAPTAENVRNGKYPILTPIYAVTYKDNPNENVEKLLNWILSEEGQYIINESGYVSIK